jgi:ATP-binding cassette subfamily B protein
VLLPLLVLPALQERDLKLRNHVGALARFYLDALVGLVPVRTHSAEKAVRREHEGLVTEWARAHLGRERLMVALEAVELPVLLLLVSLLLGNHLQRSGLGGGVLLLVYWGLNLHALSMVAAQVLSKQVPSLRSISLRLLEPLGAPSEVRSEGGAGAAAVPATSEPGGGLSICLDRLEVTAGGHTLLQDIDIDIAAGDHVALVGPSGAGKTTLAGTILGWHRPSGGRLLIGGEEPSPERLERLRSETAWVDPDVQLWNRSLLRNLRYGREEADSAAVGRAIDQADLVEVLEVLPDGLQSSLGESGGLLSGGEGQRVRLGRALLRSGCRLVILDEPFRGLDRPRRRELLRRARQLWHGVTLLCITHDLWETAQFDRVAVLDRGRLVEDGRPENLVADPESRFSRMLRAETEVVHELWNQPGWKRLRLEGRRLVPATGQAEELR